jgi:hypothetical protein
VTDRERTSAKAGIVTLFDRRIEGVHVDMDDLARVLHRPLPYHGGNEKGTFSFSLVVRREARAPVLVKRSRRPD